MRKILFIAFVIMQISCVTKKQIEEGTYLKKGKDYAYCLTLKKDKTFTFSRKYFEVEASCEGKWIFTSKDTISLICNEEKLFAQITSGYMKERNPKVIVINQNKIKIDNVVLKNKTR